MRNTSEPIVRAAQEVIEGKFDADFAIDIYQTGSGTSTNMNANEIIANRAIEMLGRRAWQPHDPPQRSCQYLPIQQRRDSHGNPRGGSGTHREPSVTRPCTLHKALAAKAREFDEVMKIGRTHLMDATPIRLGQEFSGYARQVELGIRRLESTRTSSS